MTQIYPFQTPIILNDIVFSQYGGAGTGTFASAILQNAYLTAEMQVTSYIGTPLLPTNLTGTYPFMHQSRICTDYGYVQSINNVSVLTRQGCNDCGLTSNEGCGYVYQDTFGYVDFRQLQSICGWSWWGYPYSPYILSYAPYEIQIAYTAGLPTGTATQPGILRALTIVAQIALDDMFPGIVGQNESVGAVGIQEFKSLDYSERRAEHALVKTALGDDARSQRAKKLIDMSVKRARKVLFA
jgi:hypothetical protein